MIKQFDFQWPISVQYALNVLSLKTTKFDLVLSVDCLLQNTEFFTSKNSYYLQVVLYSFLPLVLGLLSTLVWWVIYRALLIFNGRRINFILNSKVTFFAIINVLYQSLANSCFSLIDCQKFDDDNNYYLKKDMEIQCWTPQHIKYTLLIGLP